MSPTNHIATPLLVAALFSSGSFAALAQNSFMASKTAPSAGYTVDVREIALPGANHAFEDGMLGARLDSIVHRTVSPSASHLFRHPPVKGREAIVAYREKFTAGYQAALLRN